mgnify:CR=1 FL=1
MPLRGDSQDSNKEGDETGEEDGEAEAETEHEADGAGVRNRRLAVPCERVDERGLDDSLCFIKIGRVSRVASLDKGLGSCRRRQVQLERAVWCKEARQAPLEGNLD